MYNTTRGDKNKRPREQVERLFNDISSVQVLVNRQLKVLASKIGIVEKLIAHMAWHSLADKAR